MAFPHGRGKGVCETVVRLLTAPQEKGQNWVRPHHDYFLKNMMEEVAALISTSMA